MITRVSGRRSRSARIASTPSSFGITRSIRTTAGRSCSASSTASAPSAASPTISIPSWSSRKLRRPSRRTAWSSAISTRIRSGIEVHRGAFALHRPDLEAPADPLCPFFHRRQPQSPRTKPGSLRIEADAVIHDVELEPSVGAADANDDAACPRVTKRILHGFLGDPEHLGVATRIGLQLEIALHFDLGRLYSPQHLDMLAQCPAEAVPDEVRRPQLEDQRAQLVERLPRDLLELDDLPSCRL